jgi:hypothetical protein
MFGHNYIQTNTNNVNKTEQKLFYPLAPIVLVSTNAMIHGFLNSWFQTLQATINGGIVFR